MTDKETGELRRRYKPDRTNITAVYGCYVSGSGEILSEFRQPVAVPFGNFERAIATRHGRSRLDDARIRAKAERAALVDVVALAGHEVDDLVLALLVKFGRERDAELHRA